MSISAVLARIQKNDLHPVYVISGDEPWSKRRLLQTLKSTVVDESMADFNLEQVSGTEVHGVAVVDAAGMLPMMADRRLVIVEAADKWKSPDWEALKQYVQSPADTACVVIDLGTGRLKPWMNASKNVSVVKIARPKPWELADYVAQLARELGLKLDRDAVTLMAEYAGDELEKIVRDLEVLALYKGDDPKITGEDVAALLGRTRNVTQWELNQLVGTRSLGEALVKVGDILASGHDAIALMAVVINHMRQLWQVKALITSGMRDRNAIAQAVGLPPKIAGDLMSQQARFSNVELRQAFSVLSACDLQLKSARIRPDVILDRALAMIMARGPFAPPDRSNRQ
ncbi:MAG: DNA polymerase III subunit delta [Acidobacteria bacterium]|nr:DNA polymerase III subunit delta [Acidobacteriota bacterium]